MVNIGVDLSAAASVFQRSSAGSIAVTLARACMGAWLAGVFFRQHTRKNRIAACWGWYFFIAC
jgi:hypothetical protein